MIIANNQCPSVSITLSYSPTVRGVPRQVPHAVSTLQTDFDICDDGRFAMHSARRTRTIELVICLRS